MSVSFESYDILHHKLIFNICLPIIFYLVGVGKMGARRSPSLMIRKLMEDDKDTSVW